MRSKKPEWVSSFVDQNQYKLTQAELMQKKVSLISKHRKEAKDQWQQVQNKLKNNVIDEDTQKIYDTALQSKGINGSTSKRRNLTQMIEWEKNEKLNTQNSFQTLQQSNVIEEAKLLLGKGPDKENEFIDKVKQDLKDTRDFVQKMKRHKQPERALRSLDRSQKKEIKEVVNEPNLFKKENNKEKYDFLGMRNLDNVINFLENTLSQEKQNQQESESIQKPLIQGDISRISEQSQQIIDVKTNYDSPNFNFNPTIKVKLEDQFKMNLMNETIKKMEKENPIKFVNHDQQQQYNNQESIQEITNQNDLSKIDQKLNFDNMARITHKPEISFDDNIDQLKQMLEMTRQELNQMNLQDPSFIENDTVLNDDSKYQQRSFDMKQIHNKYKTKNTFDIRDYCN